MLKSKNSMLNLSLLGWVGGGTATLGWRGTQLCWIDRGKGGSEKTNHAGGTGAQLQFTCGRFASLVGRRRPRHKQYILDNGAANGKRQMETNMHDLPRESTDGPPQGGMDDLPRKSMDGLPRESTDDLPRGNTEDLPRGGTGGPPQAQAQDSEWLVRVWTPAANTRFGHEKSLDDLAPGMCACAAIVERGKYKSGLAAVPPSINVCAAAAAIGDMGFMRFVRDMGCLLDVRAINAAIFFRQTECLRFMMREWTVNHYPLLDDTAFLLAVAKGSVADLRILCGKRKVCSIHDSKSAELCRYAACRPPGENEDALAIMHFLREECDLQLNRDSHPCIWDANVCMEAAKRGNIELLRQLRRGFTLSDGTPDPCPWDASVCAVAVRFRNVECLRFLLGGCTRPGGAPDPCPFDVGAYHIAADVAPKFATTTERSIDCIRCLHDTRRVAWDSMTCLIPAVRGNHACLHFLLRGCTQSDGSPDPCPCDWLALSAAAGGGHIDCLRLLREQIDPCDSNICQMAAQNGHTDCLRLLREGGIPCPWDETTRLWGLKHGIF